MESAAARHNNKNRRLLMKVQELKLRPTLVTKIRLLRIVMLQFHVIFKTAMTMMISMYKVHRKQIMKILTKMVHLHPPAL